MSQPVPGKNPPPRSGVSSSVEVDLVIDSDAEGHSSGRVDGHPQFRGAYEHNGDIDGGRTADESALLPARVGFVLRYPPECPSLGPGVRRRMHHDHGPYALIVLLPQRVDIGIP